MLYWPSEFGEFGIVNATPAAGNGTPEKPNGKAAKEAFNRHVQELKEKFEQDVNAIANEFSGQGVHRSAKQVRDQILFTMGENKKTRSPHVSNAWAHAIEEAGRLDTESLSKMSYDTAYLSLLDDIKMGIVTQEDVSNPQTPEDECHWRVLLDGVLTSHKHCGTKKHIASPELSAHWLAYHAQNQIEEIVSDITNIQH
ncbi:uncharacterized protein EI90DRAFT_3132513 [Cantharellus anzutake]|uniref:uncharacterized protein n=1 Tax=Cantharellus anzutake TaxID=1750568 RepID=UPI0019058CA0|nr:uncharacterized protein EI90DRAFT_3132513 [Cantharellus anzutake]KAF8319512.1 hypothetical protein EI90DRAFT_3132513 [Cantharellus anzutake]